MAVPALEHRREMAVSVTTVPAAVLSTTRHFTNSNENLASLQVGLGERCAALLVILVSAAAFAAALPFARVQLAAVPAFIPAYEAALAINDLMTAVLLFGQLGQRRSGALFLLGSAYLFDALLIVPHALTFPGLFSAHGLLGAGSQSTAWLYMFWHGGFALFVMGYALLGDYEVRAGFSPLVYRLAIVTGLVLAIGGPVGATLLVTVGHDAFPTLLGAGGYTRAMMIVASLVWLLCIGAAALLLRRRLATALDLWLTVSLCALVFDVALGAVFNAGRFDLGFYAGRAYGLLAASFVLIVLLFDTKGLHRRLAAASRRLGEHARELETRVAERTTELARTNESLAFEIGERERSAQELMRVRTFLDVIIDTIPASLVVKNAQDRTHVLINRAAEDLIGRSRGEITGKTVHELLPKAEADAIAAHDLQTLSSGRPHETAEFSFAAGNRGTRLVRMTSVPMLDDQGRAQYVLGVGEDVTEQRQTEAQLHHAQKMEAIGNLTGGMAHDFNNLLAVVIGNLDVLSELLGNHTAARELAGEALEAGLRGADLTRRLLAFARKQPLKPEQVDPNKLVDNITQLLARTLGQQITVTVRLAPTVWPVLVDPAQLEAALTNLATNARDAMPEGGQLTIFTENRQLDTDYAIVHRDVTPGDYVMIEVSDTGTGMPPDVAAHIFEPFFTTKKEGKGTGLGLAMVFGFMKQSGGHINVYSEVGVGTTFRLYIPRSGPAEIGGLPATTEELPLGGGERVLVVEDYITLRKIVVRQLTELGYHVVEAESATRALTLLEKEPVDLLFTDVIMPGELSGLQLVKFALSRWPNLRIVLTSGFPGGRSGQALGGLQVPLLSKPYRKQDLARVVRSALDVRGGK